MKPFIEMTTHTQQRPGILRIGHTIGLAGMDLIFFYYADTREGKGAGLEDLLGETERIPRPASFRF